MVYDLRRVSGVCARTSFRLRAVAQWPVGLAHTATPTPRARSSKLMSCGRNRTCGRRGGNSRRRACRCRRTSRLRPTSRAPQPATRAAPRGVAASPPVHEFEAAVCRSCDLPACRNRHGRTRSSAPRPVARAAARIRLNSATLIGGRTINCLLIGRAPHARRGGSTCFAPHHQGLW